MALPTAAEFSAFFPELTADVDEVDPLLQRAALWVDPNEFAPGDYGPAIMYLAAHYLVLIRAAEAVGGVGGDASGGSGQGGTSSSSQGGTQTYVSEVSIGDRKIKYATAGGKSSSSTSRSSVGSATGIEAGLTPTTAGLGATMYGLEYLRLRNRNIPAIAIV